MHSAPIILMAWHRKTSSPFCPPCHGPFSSAGELDSVLPPASPGEGSARCDRQPAASLCTTTGRGDLRASSSSPLLSAVPVPGKPPCSARGPRTSTVGMDVGVSQSPRAGTGTEGADGGVKHHPWPRRVTADCGVLLGSGSLPAAGGARHLFGQETGHSFSSLGEKWMSKPGFSVWAHRQSLGREQTSGITLKDLFR